MPKCELKECRSGKPARHMVHETIDDGCWNIDICSECFNVLRLPKDHVDIGCTRPPDAGDPYAKVNLRLREHYKGR